MSAMDWMQLLVLMGAIGASGAAMTWLLLWVGGMVTDGVVEGSPVPTGRGSGRRSGVGLTAHRRSGRYGVRSGQRRPQRQFSREHGMLRGLRD